MMYTSVTDITENYFPTVYDLHIYQLLKFVLTCIRPALSHKSLTGLLTLQNFICLRSTEELESSCFQKHEEIQPSAGETRS